MLCGLVASSFLLAACSHAGGENVPRSTLEAGAAIEPNSFNPLLVTESIENDLNRLVFNGLTVVNHQNRIEPDLATRVPTQANGGISKDGKTITYRLRKGVRWQDGAPFTARDVKFTWKAIMNPANAVGNRVPYDEVQSVDTPDPYTVVFHLKEPYAPFVAEAFDSVTISFILPAHLLAKYQNLNRIAFNHAPVGTGPYRVERWIRGDRIEFAANRDYFKGAPKIKRIVVHAIPNENTGVNELRAHEIQWYPYLSEASYNLLKGVSGVRIVVTPQNAYRAIYINTQRPYLSDVRVRRAIAYAIDKRELVEKVTHGTGTVATEDIPSFMWAYNPNVPVYAYDPAKARALLREAGWPAGRTVTLALREGAAGDTEMAVMVQAWLRAVGMNVNIKTYPGSMLFAIGPAGVLQPGKYELDISGFSSSADPDNSAQFTCASRPPGGFNWTRYCNPEMDRLQAQALTTYDQAKRKAAYAKIEDLLARDVPQVYIYYQPEISAIDPSLENFKPSMISPTWNAYQWVLR